MREAGAHEVIVGEDPSGAAGYGPFHVILESVGGASLAASLTMLAQDGTCVIIGATGGNESTIDVRRFCDALTLFKLGVSWGGHESLVIPKCSGLEPADFDPANREHRYIRMYVGLEEPAYLVADLEQALAQM